MSSYLESTSQAYFWKSFDDSKNAEELVLDMAKIPFLSKKQLLTCAFHKLVLNDDQSVIGYIVDPNNDENLVAGFRNLKTGKFMVIEDRFVT